MDPIQFDALSRTVAKGVSRRQAVARFGAAGLLAGLTSALGRERMAGAISAAQVDTCRLAVMANVRLGPSAGTLLQGTVPGELRGELSFALGPEGAIDGGRLRLPDGTELAVVGQVTGRALNLRVDIAPEQTLILVGTAAQPLDQCTGDVDGLLTGPAVGDLGDWHATATALDGGGTTAGAPAAATRAPTGATATATAARSAPTATGAAVATGTVAPTATGTAAATATATPAPCPAGQTNCGVCVDTSSDPNHCGGCGQVCPGLGGLVCSGGRCGCPSGWTECGQPGQATEGYCADLGGDPANCGACGTACAPGQDCNAGVCVGCPAPLVDCGGGACSDLQSDTTNCGACGIVCASGGNWKACLAGTCGCPAPYIDCGGAACVDPANDPANCGGCGIVCSSGQVCNAGVCQCETPLVDCGGVCVDTLSDPNNCGACGTACESVFGLQECVLGICQ